MRNQTKKLVAKAMKQAAAEGMKMQCDKPNEVFKLAKFMRKNGKDMNDHRRGKWGARGGSSPP